MSNPLKSIFPNLEKYSFTSLKKYSKLFKINEKSNLSVNFTIFLVNLVMFIIMLCVQTDISIPVNLLNISLIVNKKYFNILDIVDMEIDKIFFPFEKPLIKTVLNIIIELMI